MNKLILTAALLALATPASAYSLPPTDPLIGSWCEVEGSPLMKRGTCKQDSAKNTWAIDSMIISSTGYSSRDTSCTFHTIKQIHKGIEASMYCQVESLFSFDEVTLQIIGGRLKFNTVTSLKAKSIIHDTTCLKVQPTPDGYLNVRQGPGMKYLTISKLVPGQRILADFQTDEWIHIKNICDASEGQFQSSGWVYKKYIENQPLDDSPTTDEFRDDWCRRNNWDGQ
jgi:hypothetical protein